MDADLPGVVLELCRPRRLVGRLQGLEIGLERRLGVDDDVLPVGKPDDHVGPQTAVFGRCRLLLDEVAVLDHPGHLHDPLELDLAPAAADGGRAEGPDEIRRLALQSALGEGQRLELLGERCIGRGADLFDLADPAVDLFEGFLQRLDELVDRPLAGGQVVLGAFLVLLQRRLRQVEEGLVVAPEGLGGEGLEGVGELAAGVLQKGKLLFGCAALLLPFDFRLRQARPEVAALVPESPG